MAALMTLAILRAAAGGTQAIGAIRTADREAADLKKQAGEEALAAKQQAVQRADELNKVLAQNIVTGAASSIGFEGSPQAIAQATSRDIGFGEQAENLSTRLRQERLHRQARNVEKAGRVRALSSLLGAGADIAMAGVK